MCINRANLGKKYPSEGSRNANWAERGSVVGLGTSRLDAAVQERLVAAKLWSE